MFAPGSVLFVFHCGERIFLVCCDGLDFEGLGTSHEAAEGTQNDVTVGPLG